MIMMGKDRARDDWTHASADEDIWIQWHDSEELQDLPGHRDPTDVEAKPLT